MSNTRIRLSVVREGIAEYDKSLPLPTPILDQAIDAFAAAYGWPEKVPDPDDPAKEIPNPETKVQHFARRIRTYVQEVTQSQIVAAGNARTKSEVEAAAAQFAAIEAVDN